jgi:hypothetical protein
MDDTVGASPPADVGAAPAAPADASADQPMTRLEIAEAISRAPREDQPELYKEYSRIFHSQAAAPFDPATPGEGARKLEQLAQTPGYLQKLESGDYETLQEWRRLNALKAEATAPFDSIDQTPDFSLGPGLGDTLSRRDQIDAASWLRARDASDQEIAFILSGEKYPRADVDAARYWLPKLEADPNLEYPGHPADRAGFLKFLKRILIIGDGSNWP